MAYIQGIIFQFMCSEYLVKVLNIFEYSLFAGLKGRQAGLSEEYHVFPKRLAPVIHQTGGQLCLDLYEYGLIPHWSKDRKLKFSTHNARIETITSKPAWRGPLKNQHCLIPISEFREAVRSGPHAGNVIGFKPKNDQLIFAAGVYDLWKGEQETVFSFAMLTRAASTFVESCGHDREPVFLSQQQWQEWLANNQLSAKDSLQLLSTAEYCDSYHVSVARKLKSSQA